MSTINSIFYNIELLPIELQHLIYKQLSLSELFIYNSFNITSINSYIQYYFEKEEYKKQSKLKDCMFLIKLDEYKDSIFSYLYDLVTDIGLKFKYDVHQAGGPTSYTELSSEEYPRDIYTIKIISTINSDEYEYIITSVGGLINNQMIYYNFGHIDKPKNTRFITYNQPNIIDEIIDKLLNIIDIMRLDKRILKSIQYYKEKYSHDFIRTKSSILYLDNGYNLF